MLFPIFYVHAVVKHSWVEKDLGPLKTKSQDKSHFQKWEGYNIVNKASNILLKK